MLTNKTIVRLGLALMVSAIQLPVMVIPALAATGLQNPGFETGSLDGKPNNWNVVTAADAVKVVDAEGPGEFAAYKDMNNVTVYPYKGIYMLRQGTPKKSAEKQPAGVNSVNQTFQSNSNPISFSFRLFSWEFRGQDVFRFNLTDSSGKTVGKLTPFTANISGVPTTFSKWPFSTTISMPKNASLIDTNWVKVTITEVPSGPLTLTYAIEGTKDNAHATWAYFDNANTPPVADFTF